MGVKGIIAATDAIRAMPSVASISLSGNKITGMKRERREWKYDLDLSGIIAFGEAAAVSKTLASIDLSDCGISSKGIAEVARFMSAGSSIVEVNVSLNNIGTDGAKALGEAIPDSSLQWVVIGAKAIRVPVHNSELTSLNFQGQSLGPAEVIVIAAAMSTNSSIASLKLDSNGIFGELYSDGAV